MLTDNTVFQICTYISSTELAVFVRFCIYFPDDDILEVETGRRGMSNYYYYY